MEYDLVHAKERIETAMDLIDDNRVKNILREAREHINAARTKGFEIGSRLRESLERIGKVV